MGKASGLYKSAAQILKVWIWESDGNCGKVDQLSKKLEVVWSGLLKCGVSYMSHVSAANVSISATPEVYVIFSWWQLDL